MQRWCRWLPYAFIEYWALKNMSRHSVIIGDKTAIIINPFYGVYIEPIKVLDRD